jgi:hypothetical protein
VQTKRPPVTKVVSVKKRSLNEQGYKDLEHWLANPNNVYSHRYISTWQAIFIAFKQKMHKIYII